MTGVVYGNTGSQQWRELWLSDTHNTLGLPDYTDAVQPFNAWVDTLVPVWRADHRNALSFPDYAARTVPHGEVTTRALALWKQRTCTTDSFPDFLDWVRNLDPDLLALAADTWTRDRHRSHDLKAYAEFLEPRRDSPTLSALVDRWRADPRPRIDFMNYIYAAEHTPTPPPMAAPVAEPTPLSMIAPARAPVPPSAVQNPVPPSAPVYTAPGAPKKSNRRLMWGLVGGGAVAVALIGAVVVFGMGVFEDALPKSELEEQVRRIAVLGSGSLGAAVECDGGLPAKVDASTDCTVTVPGKGSETHTFEVIRVENGKPVVDLVDDH